VGGWVVERVLHFERGDFVRAGLAHFGFHLRDGSYCAINHQDHFVAMIDPDGAVTFTVAPSSILPGVPNVRAELKYPIYADQLPDGDLIVSNFGNCLLFRVSEGGRRAHVLVSGHALGMADMGNCVVDDAGFIWVNEVTGCRLWRFDAVGHPLETLGDGRPGFQLGAAMFEDARFGSIYDIRRGDDGRIYVLDSGNFAVRVVDPTARTVETLAGTGTPGYEGDGGDARTATFGSDPETRFDGPISLSLDEAGNVYIGDRCNSVVRMVDQSTGIITTIAGAANADDRQPNDHGVTDPGFLNLPRISSMDYSRGRLYVPTDLPDESGDLAVLRRLPE
jgi:hypothetical protein